jgi:hypothetical protein
MYQKEIASVVALSHEGIMLPVPAKKKSLFSAN